MKKLTLDQTDKLLVLADQIRKRFESCEQFILSANYHNRAALAEVVLFAQALVEAKTIVGRTAFPGWLRKHARNTALHAAADRWMPLASFKSTRSAYRRIGVVDEDDG